MRGNCLRKTFLVVAIGIFTSSLIGCGGGGDTATEPSEGDATSQRASSNAAPDIAVSKQRYAQPDQTVSAFLTALKSGIQSDATALLTTKAQIEMAKASASIQPPGSGSAEFEVTEVKYLGAEQTGAHVWSTWTDREEDGTESQHDIVWILRRETDGWAIAGFATIIFEDQDPLVLNFEDPQELQQKRMAVDEEIATRRGSDALR